MRLFFEHGTLVLSDAPERGAERLPGMIWDPRVALYRAPAWRYAEILAALRGSVPPLRDEVKCEQLPGPGGEWSARELRPYQREALLSWELAGRRGMVVLPTGSGKTQVAIAAIASAGLPTLCLVPTRALLEQWLSVLSAAYTGPIGCLGDGRHELCPVTVATFESAYRSMPRIGARFGLLVVDEAHHFGSGLRDEALEMSIAGHRLGLTATPPPLGPARVRLEQLLGPSVYRLEIADLAGHWLAEFELLVVHLGLSREERARYDADRRIFEEVNRRFRRLDPRAPWGEFVSAVSQTPEGRAALAAWRRNRRLLQFTAQKSRAVGELLARHRESRVLIFTADNEAAYAIAREHLLMPITCDISRQEREAALGAFRAGELRALVSARVLNEGIDVPDADVAIVVAGARGEREHIQRVGRLLRPRAGKRALIYELVTFATSEARRANERRRSFAAAGAAEI